MDIGEHSVREVIIDDQIHMAKIDTSGYDVSCDQHKEYSFFKLLQYFLSFLLTFLSRQHLYFFR